MVMPVKMGSAFSLFPLELVEHISSFVLDPRDLLSLALTERLLVAVVQNHLQFRTIRCGFRRSDLWAHLVESPDIAVQVTCLEIIEEDPGELTVTSPVLLPNLGPVAIGPAMTRNDLLYDDLEYIHSCMVALAAAIRGMPCLIRFQWFDEPCRPRNTVFAALKQSCAGIVSLEILYNCSIPANSLSDLNVSAVCSRFSWSRGFTANLFH